MFEDDNLEDYSFNINKDFAKRFEHNKKREELHRLQEKYGKDLNNLDDSNDSTDTDEDDDAMFDSIAKDKSFLRVLSKLKSKDPEIYNKDKKWFEEEDEEKEESGKSKEKPMFLKDYERETLLAKGSLVIDSDDETPRQPTYTDEQRSLKENLKNALDGRDDDEPVLSLRSKTVEEKHKEDDDYKQWLKGERTKLKDPSLKSDYGALRDIWADPELGENEKFLRDFILNKGWAEDDKKGFVPTYDEIINDDEDEENEHDAFERKFNFRFEEPGHDLIKHYPRTIANSVRKTDEKRKEKRKKKEDRKTKEKEERRREIERLKKLKLEEIQEKLKKLTDSAGKDMNSLDANLEEDFSPEQHDIIMSKLFNDEYYNVKDTVKPVFSESDDDLLNDEDWFNKITETSAEAKEEVKEPTNEEDPPGNPLEEPTVIYREDEEELIRKKSWKRKRSKKFKEAVIKPKPVFNPDEGTFERYFDEYYKLDCEDVIGDTCCRFGYRKTTPETYGLTVDEILQADEKELNQWFSFKKMMKHRTPAQEAKDTRKFNNKKHNQYMKRQVLPSLFIHENEAEEETRKPKKRKQKLEKEETNVRQIKKKTSKSKISQSRLDAYGLS